jgi:geranyl-CoA carboxylase alpha subunit
LSFTQGSVELRGHAIEVRICAEDPQADFVPQSGTITAWRPPTTLRVEHCLEAGAVLPPYYDSMIAKVISHGMDREEARRKLIAGLQDMILFGVTTNLEFLQDCLSHSEFQSGNITTAFISDNIESLLRARQEISGLQLAVAAVLLRVTGNSSVQERRSLALRHPIPLRMEIADRIHDAVMQAAAPGQFRVEIRGDSHTVEFQPVDSDSGRIKYGTVSTPVQWVRSGHQLVLKFSGRTLRAIDRSHTAIKPRADLDMGKVRATMSGRVVAVHAKVGDSIGAGEGILTLEAMKMEHTLVARVDGVVVAVNAALGDQVRAAYVIAEIRQMVPA